jgi:peroxidase
VISFPFIILFLGHGGLDLTAVNIQRGRDHGLPGFNDLRKAFGLSPYTNWEQIHPDPAVWQRLSAAYKSIDDCDIYVCGLAEFHDYGNLGETFTAVVTEQYLRIRDGDRFWFQNGQWDAVTLAEITSTNFADVIARNTPIPASALQCFVFSSADGCGSMYHILESHFFRRTCYFPTYNSKGF